VTAATYWGTRMDKMAWRPRVDQGWGRTRRGCLRTGWDPTHTRHHQQGQRKRSVWTRQARAATPIYIYIHLYYINYCCDHPRYRSSHLEQHGILTLLYDNTSNGRQKQGCEVQGNDLPTHVLSTLLQSNPPTQPCSWGG